MVHELKTDSRTFQMSWDDKKPWEIRLDDRGYRSDDTLVLRETVHSGEEMKKNMPLLYTGRVIVANVTGVLQGGVYGLAEGWVILSLGPMVKIPYWNIRQ